MYSHEYVKQDYEERNKILSNDIKPNKLIDSTILKPETTKVKILELCDEAVRYDFRAVCVPPAWVLDAKNFIMHTVSNVKVCTVIGFPNGNTSTDAKVEETKIAITHGADEIDFVQNIGWVKDQTWSLLENEYFAIITAAQGRLVKIILETSLLTNDEIFECAYKAGLNGVHVIKTSTGFGSRGATLTDIEIISRAIHGVKSKINYLCGIKASGGVRCLADAELMIKAGATRLGTSNGKIIVANDIAILEY